MCRIVLRKRPVLLETVVAVLEPYRRSKKIGHRSALLWGCLGRREVNSIENDAGGTVHVLFEATESVRECPEAVR